MTFSCLPSHAKTDREDKATSKQFIQIENKKTVHFLDVLPSTSQVEPSNRL